MPQSTSLERALFDTVRYWALFERPVTAVGIWRSVVIYQPHSPVRWQGLRVPSLQHVQDLLAESQWLKERLNTQHGYYFLRGQEHIVPAFLTRHRLAQLKWRITRRVVRSLAYVPFVRGIFGSGSLAVMNTRPASDLDLFIVVKKGRIWTARLFLLLVAQLTGRRRHYWDREAPDRVCLNHYATEDSILPPVIHNLYTAMLYTHFVPLLGQTVAKRFVAGNYWVKKFVMYPEMPQLQHAYAIPRRRRLLKRFLEAWLSEPVGETLETWAEKVQRGVIARHTQPDQKGRIALSDDELAFHPDSKVDALLAAYAQDPGQVKLL